MDGEEPASAALCSGRCPGLWPGAAEMARFETASSSPGASVDRPSVVLADELDDPRGAVDLAAARVDGEDLHRSVSGLRRRADLDVRRPRGAVGRLEAVDLGA